MNDDGKIGGWLGTQHSATFRERCHLESVRIYMPASVKLDTREISLWKMGILIVSKNQIC